MKVKFKKTNPNAVIPIQTKGNAGMDMTAVEVTITPYYIEYNTGISAEIPDGYVGLLFPRSSISNKMLSLANSVGVIDSDYRGDIKLRFKSQYEAFLEDEIYAIGERVGQLIIMPYPYIESIDVGDDELSSTDRGNGGFGSTGK